VRTCARARARAHTHPHTHTTKAAAATVAEPVVPTRNPKGLGGEFGAKKMMPLAIIGAAKSLIPKRGSSTAFVWVCGLEGWRGGLGSWRGQGREDTRMSRDIM